MRHQLHHKTTASLRAHPKLSCLGFGRGSHGLAPVEEGGAERRRRVTPGTSGSSPQGQPWVQEQVMGASQKPDQGV